jgi:hypothetical protein
MKTKIATLLIVTFCSVATFRGVAADGNEGPGRYHIFQESIGLYAFDTHTGEVFFLKLIKGDLRIDSNKLVWIKLSNPISEAITPDKEQR